MTVIARAVKTQHRLALGMNVLRKDAESALAIATAVGAEFIRVNVYTGTTLTDQGLIQGVVHRLVRYRKSIGSEVKILADVDVKHSVAVGTKCSD